MTYSPEFEAFWAAYPKRLGPNPKAAAAKVFAKLTRVISPGDLIRAATTFATECVKLKVDPAFVPHARTWLAQERWTDYLAQPEAAQAVPATDLPELYHRLRLRRPDLTAAVWKSWFSALAFDQRADGTVITTPSAFTRDYCRTHWGYDLAVLLGQLEWRVATRASDAERAS